MSVLAVHVPVAVIALGSWWSGGFLASMLLARFVGVGATEPPSAPDDLGELLDDGCVLRLALVGGTDVAGEHGSAPAIHLVHPPRRSGASANRSRRFRR